MVFDIRKVKVEMSRIITHVKCKECGKEYRNFYWSFGHPDKDCIHKWKCKECGTVNELLVKAFPFKELGVFIPLPH